MMAVVRDQVVAVVIDHVVGVKVVVVLAEVMDLLAFATLKRTLNVK